MLPVKPRHCLRESCSVRLARSGGRNRLQGHTGGAHRPRAVCVWEHRPSGTRGSARSSTGGAPFEPDRVRRDEAVSHAGAGSVGTRSPARLNRRGCGRSVRGRADGPRRSACDGPWASASSDAGIRAGVKGFAVAEPLPAKAATVAPAAQSGSWVRAAPMEAAAVLPRSPPARHRQVRIPEPDEVAVGTLVRRDLRAAAQRSRGAPRARCTFGRRAGRAARCFQRPEPQPGMPSHGRPDRRSGGRPTFDRRQSLHESMGETPGAPLPPPREHDRPAPNRSAVHHPRRAPTHVEPGGQGARNAPCPDRPPPYPPTGGRGPNTQAGRSPASSSGPSEPSAARGTTPIGAAPRGVKAASPAQLP